MQPEFFAQFRLFELPRIGPHTPCLAVAMGWLKPDIKSAQTGLSARSTKAQPGLSEHDTGIEHIETVTSCLTLHDKQYIFQSTSVADEELPMIPASIVKSKRTQPGYLWIVIDKIVYDCTDFVWSHPGGNTVIESFRGEDCSWQFWRFHGRRQMDEDGRPLRIGRTSGVENRFKERPRFVGLRRNAADDD